MRYRLSASLLAIGVAWLTPVDARGQDAGDWATYQALTHTPLGAFTSPFGVGITGLHASGVEWRARFGIMTYAGRQTVQTFGLTIAAPVWDASIGLTAAYFRPTCASTTCGAHFMASASLSERLIGIQVGQGDAGGAFNIGFQGTIGFAKRGTTFASAHAEFPLSLVPARRPLRLVPYVAPGVGLGLARDSSTEAGLLFTIGTGLGLVTTRGVLMSVGLRRVFVPGHDNWLVGVDLAFGGGRT